ncbi:hypothetical protein AD946_07285 [Gluconobacter thailandicus]|nr:hypothetical protein AD946_07285 [Gluconobacter thailandicus]
MNPKRERYFFSEMLSLDPGVKLAFAIASIGPDLVCSQHNGAAVPKFIGSFCMVSGKDERSAAS